MTTKSAKCQGCGLELPSRNAIFRHLKDTNGSCLSPEEYQAFIQFVLKQEREKVLLLYGYITENAPTGKSEGTAIRINNGDDAAQVLLEVILDEENKGQNQNQNSGDKVEMADCTKRINRSYGDVSRRTDIVKQDPNTSAVSEVLAVRLPLLAVPLPVWIDAINRRLEERFRLSTISSSSTSSSCYSRRSRVRLLGRQKMSQSRFNAEMDVSHRRVEYLLPLDFLYADRITIAPQDVGGDDDFKSNRTSFFRALPSFSDGTYGLQVGGEEGVTAHNQKRVLNGDETASTIGQRPDQPALLYLHSLKRIMQSLTTHIVPLDKNDKVAVQLKESRQDKRKKSKQPKNQPTNYKESNSRQKTEDSAPKKDKSTNDTREKSEKKTGKELNKSKKKVKQSKPSSMGPNILKRRRFHNFTPTVMAHEYLAYRRMDRFYHRATLRYELQEGTAVTTTTTIACNEDESQRPFIALSLTGDVFLNGQVCRVVGVFIALARGLIDMEIVECLFNEDYGHLIPTPPAPSAGMYAAEAFYVGWEGKVQAFLTPRRSDRFQDGWCDDDTLKRVCEWRNEVRRETASAWFAGGVDADGRLVAEKEWTRDVLEPWAKRANKELDEYCRWKASNNAAMKGDASVEEGKEESTSDSVPALVPSLDSVDARVPDLFEKVLRCLRDVDASGEWPTTTPKRQLVMISTISADSELSDADRRQAVANSLSEAHVRARLNNKESRSSAYVFAEGGGGASGSFSVGAMPGNSCIQPKANSQFPELMKAAFELEIALCPDRPPSSTIAINRNAQFRPHVDSGAGAGQSTSLIVGLGTYAGGELVVEGEKKDIRYKAVEFNGWKQRHWVMPFKGERYTLVWFTPKGCEGTRGIDLCK